VDAPGRHTVGIDFKACKGCGYCSLACPEHIFEPGRAINGKGYAPYQAARPEACTGCLRCFFACPDFCLEINVDRAVHE
jgi:NAD-dependent dihydropyrimidine dehydrogenase PreA subunit